MHDFVLWKQTIVNRKVVKLWLLLNKCTRVKLIQIINLAPNLIKVVGVEGIKWLENDGKNKQYFYVFQHRQPLRGEWIWFDFPALYAAALIEYSDNWLTHPWSQHCKSMQTEYIAQIIRYTDRQCPVHCIEFYLIEYNCLVNFRHYLDLCLEIENPSDVNHMISNNAGYIAFACLLFLFWFWNRILCSFFLHPNKYG